MTAPNSHLSTWLFLLIDGSLSASIERYAKRIPYVYHDLENLLFDSVVLEKEERRYVLSPNTIGGYEDWRQARKVILNL